ncbi:MAG: hypothetical protein V4702_03990 [Patescibacteria group bacterium]
MAYIISADELKKTLPGYSPDKSEAFHHESAKLADKLYAQAVRERTEPTVILMAGGTASGKSEYVSAYLQNEAAIVLDGTLPTTTGAKIKIKKARKAQKQINVHCVLPESFLVAYVAFLNRDRKFSTRHFFRTHSATRKTVLEVAEKFPDIAVTIIMSDVDFVGDGSTMSFRELTFPDRSSLIEFLHREQYTEDGIMQAMRVNHDV